MKDYNSGEEFEYELRDIQKFASNDPRGRVKDQQTITVPEVIARELNYARALNGNPLRWIKSNTYYTPPLEKDDRKV